MPAHHATVTMSPFWSCPTRWHHDFGGWRPSLGFRLGWVGCWDRASHGRGLETTHTCNDVGGKIGAITCIVELGEKWSKMTPEIENLAPQIPFHRHGIGVDLGQVLSATCCTCRPAHPSLCSTGPWLCGSQAQRTGTAPLDNTVALVSERPVIVPECVRVCPVLQAPVGGLGSLTLNPSAEFWARATQPPGHRDTLPGRPNTAPAGGSCAQGTTGEGGEGGTLLDC